MRRTGRTDGIWGLGSVTWLSMGLLVSKGITGVDWRRQEEGGEWWDCGDAGWPWEGEAVQGEGLDGKRVSDGYLKDAEGVKGVWEKRAEGWEVGFGIHVDFVVRFGEVGWIFLMGFGNLENFSWKKFVEDSK